MHGLQDGSIDGGKPSELRSYKLPLASTTAPLHMTDPAPRTPSEQAAGIRTNEVGRWLLHCFALPPLGQVRYVEVRGRCA